MRSLVSDDDFLMRSKFLHGRIRKFEAAGRFLALEILIASMSIEVTCLCMCGHVMQSLDMRFYTAHTVHLSDFNSSCGVLSMSVINGV